MKQIEFTLHQSESDPQDDKVTLNADKIVFFRPFKYASGKVVTLITLVNHQVEVTESYETVQDRIMGVTI